MGDKDISNWDQRLKDQVDRGWDNYLRRRIYLDTARILERWGISGEFLYVEQSSSSSANIQLMLNRNTNDPLDLVAGVKIKTLFTQLFLTHNAQPGEWIDILIGINFEYHKPDGGQGGGGGGAAEAQPAVMVTNAVADTNTVAAANICNRAIIQALSANAGSSWINFGAVAVSGVCFELVAGSAMAVSISNTSRVNALFDIANDDVSIIYEV